MKGRTLKFVRDGDGDRVIVIERTKTEGYWPKWREDRVVLTRKEVAKLAAQFPVDAFTRAGL